MINTIFYIQHLFENTYLKLKSNISILLHFIKTKKNEYERIYRLEKKANTINEKNG
jgi:hypothetical protein